jgi:hypothetical protein
MLLHSNRLALLENIGLGWKKLARDKRSSLFSLLVSYDKESFITMALY